MTLTGLKRDGGGSEVSVVAEPATKVSDREIGLIAVSRGKGGLTGGRVTVHRARGMLAAGLVHRLHVCGE